MARKRTDAKAFNIPDAPHGLFPPDPVAPDSLKEVPRQQTNAARWDGIGWGPFRSELTSANIPIIENLACRSLYITDGGGVSMGMPRGVLVARSSEDIAATLKAAQKHGVPVSVRGGGLTTEGECISFGGLQLDMRGMSRVIYIDTALMTVRTEAGIYWHSLAEVLRRQGFDYISAPLNMTSSVGGTLGVGGIDINSPKYGCSADQALSLKVVTPTGDIIECSDEENSELFERVLFGYGQFGVITEATLKIRSFTPITMHYFYYSSLKNSIEDLRLVVEEEAADYAGILTILDRAINLLVAFDSDEREQEFFSRYRRRLKGYGEVGFALHMAAHYALHPWKVKEALYLLERKRTLLPELRPPGHMQDGKILDRSVVFSRAVWKFWGGKQMVIPDLATSKEKFVEAVIRGNTVCKRYFPRYTLYCVGIKIFGNRQRYELSCIPPDAMDFGYGCEFEPMLGDHNYSRDYLQSFKNDIYDIGVDIGTSYYRFGGMMKGYIRRVFGNELVDKHLSMKREADPAMVLNPDVIF